MTDPSPRLIAALADRYRVERELGSGGMATVYLAQDLKHDRKVAVKVLRPELAAVIGAERFLAEIKTTANLQHSHILPLHDSGSVDGILFYVMPYIDGESLRDRLNRERQLPVNECVRLASEIASALDYAHRHGVVHRDIKPENILLHDGSALVADFGIALAVSTAGSRMTESGMSLGTPHYMSPEQAMGEREITPRSDVYALGCVTYEMLVGEPPFNGPTAQAIVARVMTEEPRGLTIQRKSIPMHVEAAVQTALSKLPADRFASAAEFATALNDSTKVFPTPARASLSRNMSWRPIAIVGGAALIAGTALGMLLRRPVGTTDAGIVRVLMTLPDSGGVKPLETSTIAISPDGRRIAYVGPSKTGRMLWVREMNDFEGKPLAGTEGAQAPFFSPNSESIGFFGPGNQAKLMVIPATGGMIRTVVSDSSTSFGGSWGRDGNIYFTATAGGIARVPEEGGAVTRMSVPDTAAGDQEHDFVEMLPGSKGAIIQVWKGSANQNEIAALSFATGKIKTVARGTFARFLPPDKLLYGTADGRVFSVAFDEKKLTATKEPVQVLDDVRAESVNGTLQFAVSESGTLVYVPGGAIARDVVWVSRNGTETPIDSTWHGSFSDVSLSPDGSRLAMTIQGNDGGAIWVKRLPNGSLTRLTLTGASDRPTWTPDGRSVAYLAMRKGKRTAWMRRADGSNDEELVNRKAPGLDEITFAPNGQTTILRTLGTGAFSRKLLIAMGPDSAPRPLVRTDFDNYAAVLSPNGKWLAYGSNESKDNEVYVRPFPAVDSARWTISVSGGAEPMWSRSGRELFFRTTAGDMMAVPVSTGDVFQAGTPVKLFTSPHLLSDDRHHGYDVSLDDKQFIMVRNSQKNAQILGVVVNWAA
ncbi:MAG TPA: protein kinase, partial [Gemmatimonadaceae bacterium]|nr:protein kinase [Gemmatimonadaceae bacterium]